MSYMDTTYNTTFIKQINDNVNKILKKNNLDEMFHDNKMLSHNITFLKNDMIHITHDYNTKLCTYEILGTYNILSSTWFWAWGRNIKTDKNMLSTKVISLMNKKIKDPKITQIDIEHINFFMNNSIFLSKDNLNILIKLCMVLLHDSNDIECIVPNILTHNDTPIQINFYLIKKIIQTENN